jgi:hypothetical protein
MFVLRRATIVCATALASACGDEVVGFFGTETATSGASTAAATTSGVASGATSSGDGSTTTGSPDDTGFMAPGCYRDDFDNGVIDPLWNTWMEEDSALAEAGGLLKLTPPSYGLWDTGVVGAYNYVFPFVDGHVRLRVPVPPAAARPVLLFLTVGEDAGTNLSMQLTGGMVVTTVSFDVEQQFYQEFPVPTYPAWIGMRAEGDLVHFETSEDGVTFTELVASEKLGDFAIANALIMAQTYDVDTDRNPIGVDDFEVCAQ